MNFDDEEYIPRGLLPRKQFTTQITGQNQTSGYVLAGYISDHSKSARMALCALYRSGIAGNCGNGSIRHLIPAYVATFVAADTACFSWFNR